MDNESADNERNIWHKEVLPPSGPRHVFGIVYSPDGDELASACADGNVRILNADTGKVVLTLPGGSKGVLGVAYRPDRAELASAGGDGKIRIWNVDSGKKIRTLKCNSDGVLAVAYRPDGAELASAGTDGKIRIWNAGSDKPIRILLGHPDVVLGVAYRPDGTELASAGADGRIQIWNAESAKPICTLPRHPEEVWGVAYRPDRVELASAGADGAVRTWNADTGTNPKRRNGIGRLLKDVWPTIVLIVGAGVLFVVLVCLGDGAVWTWSLHAHSDASPLNEMSEWLLTFDCLLVLLYVCAAFSWLSDLRKRAADVKRNDPHRFGPASRRIHQWAGFGTVLVAAAGLADLVENGLMFANLNCSSNFLCVDAMRALAWLKMINLGVGLSLFAVASISALWRLRVEHVDRTMPPNVVAMREGHRWTSGRNQSPSEFAPASACLGVESDRRRSRLGLCRRSRTPT